jgi:hypothetical protein
VRWPARPAELRAGLDFFGSFCIKAKRTEIYQRKTYLFFLLLVQKKEPKKSSWSQIAMSSFEVTNCDFKLALQKIKDQPANQVGLAIKI